MLHIACAAMSADPAFPAVSLCRGQQDTASLPLTEGPHRTAADDEAIHHIDPCSADVASSQMLARAFLGLFLRALSALRSQNFPRQRYVYVELVLSGDTRDAHCEACPQHLHKMAKKRKRASGDDEKAEAAPNEGSNTEEELNPYELQRQKLCVPCCIFTNSQTGFFTFNLASPSMIC